MNKDFYLAGAGLDARIFDSIVSALITKLLILNDTTNKKFGTSNHGEVSYSEADSSGSAAWYLQDSDPIENSRLEFKFHDNLTGESAEFYISMCGMVVPLNSSPIDFLSANYQFEQRLIATPNPAARMTGYTTVDYLTLAESIVFTVSMLNAAGKKMIINVTEEDEGSTCD